MTGIGHSGCHSGRCHTGGDHLWLIDPGDTGAAAVARPGRCFTEWPGRKVYEAANLRRIKSKSPGRFVIGALCTRRDRKGEQWNGGHWLLIYEGSHCGTWVRPWARKCSRSLTLIRPVGGGRAFDPRLIPSASIIATCTIISLSTSVVLTMVW